MRVALFICVLLTVNGCAHTQLRKHTIAQVQTVSDMQYQQVLDNLAMFVSDPESMPFFSVPGAGGTSINTTGTAGNAITWNVFGFASDAFTLGGSRTNGGSWTLAPINDPAKLERMRCAYQIAVGYYPGGSAYECSECCQLIERWYPDTKMKCGMPCRIPPPGWYCIGCERDLPKGACLVGRHGNTRVWVSPDGLGELTRLTLTILDFATAASGYTGPTPAKQQVVRKWNPVYKGGEVVGYHLAEVTTTTQEAQEQNGIPAGAPKIEAKAPTTQSGTQETIPAPVNQFFDRPRENYFNPVLPQLELFRNP